MGACSPCGPWTELTLTQMWLDSDPHRTGSPMGMVATLAMICGILVVPLLSNRRGIEERFEDLRRAGFDTLAVIDLDHFKRVNDVCGHSVGDRVLAATGLALREDPDRCAWRLGGEEFLLLLRERNAPARAESRRQAITSRISALVPGLPAPVIASMGLVELPRGAMLATGYAELYARADRLLYEAKRNGRNRTVSERLKTFTGRRGERRKKPQAA